MLPDILICNDAKMARKQMDRALPTALLDGTAINIEVLMDMSSIFFGAFLKGIGDQMGLTLGFSHPTVFGQHRKISDRALWLGRIRYYSARNQYQRSFYYV
jgi:chemotaxis protein CheY-P-specific phosphatase CheC